MGILNYYENSLEANVFKIQGGLDITKKYAIRTFIFIGIIILIFTSFKFIGALIAKSNQEFTYNIFLVKDEDNPVVINRIKEYYDINPYKYNKHTYTIKTKDDFIEVNNNISKIAKMEIVPVSTEDINMFNSGE